MKIRTKMNVFLCFLSSRRCWFTETHLSIPGVFIVAAKRTPFGTYGGVLRDHTATDLAEHAAKAALAAGRVAPEIVDSVIVGNVMQVIYLVTWRVLFCYLFWMCFHLLRARRMLRTLLVMLVWGAESPSRFLLWLWTDCVVLASSPSSMALT